MRRYGSWLVCATMAAFLLALGGGKTFAFEAERAQPGAIARSDVSGLVQLAASVITRYDGRWFGRGSKDACGESWAMDMKVRGGKVRGRFWRGGVLYDIYGQLGSDGALLGGRGGKNQREFGVIAPRFLRFDIYFLGEEAEGSYAVSGSGGLYCQSPLGLKRTEE
jgi:hypothetical protein